MFAFYMVRGMCELFFLLFRLSFDLDLSVLFRSHSQNIRIKHGDQREWKQQHKRNDEIGTIELFFIRLCYGYENIFGIIHTKAETNRILLCKRGVSLSLCLHWFSVSFVRLIRHSSCSCSCLCSLNGIFSRYCSASIMPFVSWFLIHLFVFIHNYLAFFFHFLSHIFIIFLNSDYALLFAF